MMLKSGPEVVGYVGHGGGQSFCQRSRVEMEMNGMDHHHYPNQHHPQSSTHVMDNDDATVDRGR